MAPILALVSGILSFSPPLFVSADTDCKASSAKTPLEHMQAAQCLAAAKHWSGAEEHFRLARQSPDLVAAATVGHARVLFHLGQPYDGMLEVEDLLKTNPDFVPALVLFATLISVVLEDTGRSIEIMERCSKLAPNNAEVWQQLGNLYLLKHRDEEAVRCFEQAVRLRPEDPYSLASLAYAYGQTRGVETAQARFDKALQLSAQAPEPKIIVGLMYGKFLLEQKRWAESLSVYNRALQLEPRSSEAHYGRAVAHENLKDFARAEADALEAIREYAQRKDAYLLLIRVARAQKDEAKMHKYVNEVERINAEEQRQKEEGRHLQACLLKAEPLLRQGKYAEAAAVYEELLSRHPKFYEAYFALGMCYANLSQLSKAEEAFRKHLDLQPFSADGHASLGLLLLQQHRTRESQPELERALEIDPAMLEARTSLARIHVSNTDFSKALAVLLRPPSREADWDADYYVLIVGCYRDSKQRQEALAFCQRGRSRFPAADQLARICASLKHEK
jgi:tetratricopeptide (TPR) repeat protein